MANTDICYSFGSIIVLLYTYGVECAAPPVRNTTYITLYLAELSWNDASSVCQAAGGHLLDMKYYSIFTAVLKMSTQSPWFDLPNGNELPAWIGLHRQDTYKGSHFYTGDCDDSDDLQVYYWNSPDPYNVMAGPDESYCVYDHINVTIVNTDYVAKHGYTRDNCTEKHNFYCQHESGGCSFVQLGSHRGVTDTDLSANDIDYPYNTFHGCSELCLNASAEYPHSNIVITEECWAFTITGSVCRLHIVINPMFFDNVYAKEIIAGHNLFLKKCFEAVVNDEAFSSSDSPPMELPESTCGVDPNSTMVPDQVEVYSGSWTWNEAYSTCRQRDMYLLNVKTLADEVAMQMLHDKYKDTLSLEIVWLGLHEPEPLSKFDVRVWSDCDEPTNTSWDQTITLNSDLSDTSLCTLVNMSSNLWYTATCNEGHSFICQWGNGTTWQYDSGTTSTLGTGSTLGPYDITETECHDLCSTITHDVGECWAYAARDDTDKCYLYFTNDPLFQSVNISSTVDPFVLYRKQLWTDVIYTSSDVDPNVAVFPYSCCNVTDMTVPCTTNTVPEYDADSDIPTTVKQQLVLHTAVATWTRAIETCRSYGGTLLQMDKVSKRFMVQRYMDAWVTDGQIVAGDVWLGLSNAGYEGACSLHWSRDCSRAEWTDFADMSYQTDAVNKCVAVSTGLKLSKLSCDQELPFVCEVDDGACDVDTVSVDTNCKLGTGFKRSTSKPNTCSDLCKTDVRSDMECWASVITATDSCLLFYYQDPGYCQDNVKDKTNFTATFKNCYTAAVNTSSKISASNANLRWCSTKVPYPYVRDYSVCEDYPPSTTSTTSQTTIPTPTSTPSSTSITSTTVSTLASFTTTILSTSTTSTTRLSTASPLTTPKQITPSTSDITPTNSVTALPTGTSRPPNNISLSKCAFTADPNRPIYVWPCLCHNITAASSSNVTLEEWQTWNSDVNIVRKYETSRYKRSRLSVYNSSTSNVTIGLVASLVLALLLLTLIVLDVPIVLAGFRTIHRKHKYTT